MEKLYEQTLKDINVPKLSPLSLSALFDLLDQRQVQPEDARILGRILLLTEEDAAWKQDDFKKRINGLQFRTQTGGWANAETLLIDYDGNTADQREESLRFRLAPLFHRLHVDYRTTTDEQTPALDFFRHCRERMQAWVGTLEKWILAAREDADRLAALVYLADGEQGEKVAELVREKDWLQNISPALMAQLTPKQRDRLQRHLISQIQIASSWNADVDDWTAQTIRPTIDLATALKRIHAWWQKEGAHQAAEHRKSLYPTGSLILGENPPDTGCYDRSSWLILFALGAFQSIGRTRDQQHRGAIQMCMDSGWWQTFAETDPRKEPNKWLQIIEEYADNQSDDEQWSLWMAQFPRLYRLSRWLDDYIDLFLSIKYFPKNEPLDLDLLLAPRTNPHFQGGGIDAPPLTRTLKMGAHLVIRELLHHGIISNPMAIPYAYAPIDRTQRFFGQFGVPIDTSKDIHDRLIEHLGADGATFNGDYDIPLRIVAADEGLQWQLFQGQVT